MYKQRRKKKRNKKNMKDMQTTTWSGAHTIQPIDNDLAGLDWQMLKILGLFIYKFSSFLMIINK